MMIEINILNEAFSFYSQQLFNFTYVHIFPLKEKKGKLFFRKLIACVSLFQRKSLKSSFLLDAELSLPCTSLSSVRSIVPPSGRERDCFFILTYLEQWSAKI